MDPDRSTMTAISKEGKILLKREIAIDSDEDLKLLRCERKQFSVL